MYIFGYSFQKKHFKGSSKKGHIDKKLWAGGADDLSAPSALESLQICF